MHVAIFLRERPESFTCRVNDVNYHGDCIKNLNYCLIIVVADDGSKTV